MGTAGAMAGAGFGLSLQQEPHRTRGTSTIFAVPNVFESWNHGVRRV